MVTVNFDSNSVESYHQFLAVRSLPQYRIAGSKAIVPDEYASLLGLVPERKIDSEYVPSEFMFDYQRDITRLAIKKKKFAIFADCGLGKWLMICEYARHAMVATGKRVLIVMPLLCVQQQIQETEKFYGESLPVEQVPSGKVAEWLAQPGTGIGLTNYECFRNEIPKGNIGVLILDEASTLAQHYGKYAQGCIKLGAGLEWKLSCTGTPAPNDRIEYASQAVFLDVHRTTNEFLARYFINRGQTQNRWELKPHAIKPFYRDLSHWCIFLTNPATYGWKDNCENIPPIHVKIERVELTPEQRKEVQLETGCLFASELGGITSRSKMARIAKGIGGSKVPTNKPAFIKSLVESWPEESTIIWCKYNDEQDQMEKLFPDAASIKGATSTKKRHELIEEFKSGSRRILISKPEIMGYGLNLQVCTRMVFSGLQDSYLLYYQAVKRANRVGSTRPLHVHIPVTEIEEPMIDTVLRKASRIQEDTETQEQLFKEIGWLG